MKKARQKNWQINLKINNYCCMNIFHFINSANYWYKSRHEYFLQPNYFHVDKILCWREDSILSNFQSFSLNYLGWLMFKKCFFLILLHYKYVLERMDVPNIIAKSTSKFKDNIAINAGWNRVSDYGCKSFKQQSCVFLCLCKHINIF